MSTAHLPPISQSLIKQVRGYRKGTHCGLLLKAEWFEGFRAEPSKEMRLGQWFEWKATGQRNYYGEIPTPDRTPSKAAHADREQAKTDRNHWKKWYENILDEREGAATGPKIVANLKKVRFEIAGKPLQEYTQDLRKMEKAFQREVGKVNKWLWDRSPVSEEFDRAEQQAENFKAYIEEWGWKIEESGSKVVDNELQMSMTRDLDLYIPRDGFWPFARTDVAAWRTWSPERARINGDLKYTGLIGNQYHPMGWHPDTLKKSDHSLQPVQYSMVSGRDGFVFLVFGSTPKMDAVLYPVVVAEGAKEDHRKLVEDTRIQLRSALRSGFSPHPSFRNCRECPLAENCNHRVTAPNAENVIWLEGKI